MTRKLVIGLLLVAVVGLIVLVLLRKRAVAATSAMGVTSSTAATPQPQTGLASLLSGTPLSGLINTPIGQAAVNVAATYLPPVAAGLQSNIPQQGAQPAYVLSGLNVASVGVPLCSDVPPGVLCKQSTKYGSLWKAADKAGLFG